LGAVIASELGKMISDFVGRGATKSRGRKVRTFLSGSSTEAESAVEVFVLEPEAPPAAGSDEGL
jgi:hypothetical protein